MEFLWGHWHRPLTKSSFPWPYLNRVANSTNAVASPFLSSLIWVGDTNATILSDGDYPVLGQSIQNSPLTWKHRCIQSTSHGGCNQLVVSNNFILGLHVCWINVSEVLLRLISVEGGYRIFLTKSKNGYALLTFSSRPASPLSKSRDWHNHTHDAVQVADINAQFKCRSRNKNL